MWFKIILIHFISFRKFDEKGKKLGIKMIWGRKMKF